MESLKAQDTYDAALIIRQFLEATSHNERPDERSLAARLCAESLELFREIVKTLSKGENWPITKSNSVSLERSFCRLKLWSDGYGVSRGDLDDTFERSRKLRIATLKLLASIGTSLTDRLIPQLTDGSVELAPEPFSHLVREVKALVERIGDDDGESSSSDDSSDFGDDSIREIVEDLQTDTMCLMELDPLFKSPVLDVVRDKENSAPHSHVLEWAPHKAYCDKVEIRFPQAADSLIFRLGKANYERYIRCQEERDRKEHEALAGDDGNALLFLARAGTINGSNFHDSGLGTSLPPASSYAETIMSYGGGDGRSVRVPPLPPEGKAGKPFPCVACGRSVLISNNSAWKQHLYADLCPWLCLDLSCSYGDRLFKNRNDWISHLALDHVLEPRWESFECPLCHNDTGVGKLAITKHLGGHLEEISLGALPSWLDFESESDGESQDDEDIHTNISAEPEHDTILDNTVVSPSENVQDPTDLIFHPTSKVTEVDEELYMIKCVCGFSDDDGNTIYCENCDTWQHIECYYPDNVDVYTDEFSHSCVDCKPRPIDRQRAIELQKGRSLGEADKHPNLGKRAPRTLFNSAQFDIKAPPLDIVEKLQSEIEDLEVALETAEDAKPPRLTNIARTYASIIRERV